jgi:pimeloyl-ACP methyl ester carboxylesterase
MADTWARPPTTAALLVTATAVATASLLFLARASLWPRRPAVLPGPRSAALPRAARDELERLVGGNALPGARDVDTPYGSIRVYEFGPEDGPRVLFIHGISTSSMTLEPIAKALVSRGCRVMLFDLFGRGLSDGVGDLPHDPRLYVTQALLALASSPLPWTGDGALRLVGYSLGGGIAVHFANAFPHLVADLVLLAPAGLIRPEVFGITRHIYTSGLVPEVLLARLTGRRLQQPIAKSSAARAAAEADAPSPVAKLAAAEIADSAATSDPVTPLEQRVLAYVRWMVSHHAGFVAAFMSSIRHAPLVDQHASWAKLARRAPGSTVFLFARSDELIDADDYADVALPLVGGKENVVWKVLPGGHDFVMTHSAEIVQELDAHWGTKPVS